MRMEEGVMDGGRHITELLAAHAAGDSDALDVLLPRIYDELRRIAHHRLRGERDDHTLNTTGLVHEAYMKLVQLDRMDWQNRAHFFAIASQAMRNILVDYAVRRSAQKRGGDRDRVPLDDADAAAETPLDDLVALHQALEELEALDPRQARVVECRFFGGLTIDETAEALDISPATVSRDWAMARAWLNRALADTNLPEADDGSRTE
jgi:RNA polymerase sigma factor (TIGR02999 family)